MIPRLLKNNSHCDRCKKYDPIPRGYGFVAHYNLCAECQEIWENIIHKKFRAKLPTTTPKEWHIYADRLLIQFVKNKNKEKVLFT